MSNDLDPYKVDDDDLESEFMDPLMKEKKDQKVTFKEASLTETVKDLPPAYVEKRPTKIRASDVLKFVNQELTNRGLNLKFLVKEGKIICEGQEPTAPPIELCPKNDLFTKQIAYLTPDDTVEEYNQKPSCYDPDSNTWKIKKEYSGFYNIKRRDLEILITSNNNNNLSLSDIAAKIREVEKDDNALLKLLKDNPSKMYKAVINRLEEQLK
ncbi:P protein [Almendravirus cootbay]|uniref:P protein n=1 Tax=Almendravirus cootbay TaxID=1972685 RepID=UPI001E281B16|nr:P protein [Almendravirus cootbay]